MLPHQSFVRHLKVKQGLGAHGLSNFRKQRRGLRDMFEHIAADNEGVVVGLCLIKAYLPCPRHHRLAADVVNVAAFTAALKGRVAAAVSTPVQDSNGSVEVGLEKGFDLRQIRHWLVVESAALQPAGFIVLAECIVGFAAVILVEAREFRVAEAKIQKEQGAVAAAKGVADAVG